MVEPKKPMSLPLWKTGTITVMSKKCPAESQGSLVISTSPGSSVCGRKRLDEMLAGGGERIDVAGRAGDGLRHHAAAPVEQRVGEVAGLAHDRAEGDALHRLRLLADDADQVAPDDLELDAVHARSLLGGHDAAGRVAPSRASRAE